MMRRWISVLLNVVFLFSWASEYSEAWDERGNQWELSTFPIEESDIELARPVRHDTYFEAVGRHAAVIGQEQGSFEVWVYPLKIVQFCQLSVTLEGENRTILVSDLAERITVRPEAVTRTFAADAFTIHEHVFVPIDDPGAVILLDIDTDRPLSAVFSFSPELEPMWPGGLGGQYSYWDDTLRAFIITESRKKYGGVIGCPLGRRGSSTPAHELPGGGVRFEVSVEPDVASQIYIPIVVAGSVEGVEEAREIYERMQSSIVDLYRRTRSHYRALQTQFLSLRTPNTDVNLAFEWAKVAIDKGFSCNPHLGCGLVAGFGPSGISERPGFAWYFGGDTFMNCFAINSYGDFSTTRKALTFLRQYQRDDGKMMHELSQSGGMIPWFEEYPYGYYHADTTPYYIVAVRDYVRASNDTAYLLETWDSVKKAYEYCLSCETDGDGLMENAQAGLGAVEVGTLLKQIQTDMYVAGIWVKALESLSELAGRVGDTSLAKECRHLFENAHRSLNERFWNEEKGIYNFAVTTDGGVIDETTAWPAVPLLFGLLEEKRAASMLDVLASSHMSTDWGVRLLSSESEAYEPLSYNNGAVWPFLTGYTAWAEYRNHRSVSGFQHLMNMVRLTFIDALGYNTELLSGERYKPLRTAVPHQIFSSSYIITSTLRGLLGLAGDAEKRTVTLSPHLPLDWKWLNVEGFRVGEATFGFDIRREEDRLVLNTRQRDGNDYLIIFSPAFGLAADIREVILNGRKQSHRLTSTGDDVHCCVEFLPESESSLIITFTPGIELGLPGDAPRIGDRSKGMRVLHSYLHDDDCIITAEGFSGETYDLTVRMPFPVLSVEGGDLRNGEGLEKKCRVRFPQEGAAAGGYIRKQVRIRFSR